MTEGKAILITGATGGIGAALVRALSARGRTVYAGARGDAPDLASLPGVRVVRLDVTDAAGVAEAAAEVRAAQGGRGLHAVVNNAGLIVQGPMELVPPEELRRQFEVNVHGPAIVTRAFLPLLREGRGRVVNVSAASALAAPPGLGPIAASKAALESLSDATRLELAPWGIPVSVVRPGAVSTAIFGKAEEAARIALRRADPEAVAMYRPMLDAIERTIADQSPAPVDGVVRTLIKAIEARRPRRHYTCGRDARLLAVVSRLPAGPRDRIVASAFGLRRLPRPPAGASATGPANTAG
ncbi:SDR family NAD(P)-dependent oxidoreductase [Thermomonospora umbrina]|uniref:Short-subunit dehydrogenase n=1 Tax=Thermomonospora umbrina TaxID=111806 RepID=A0A3D9T2U6_9ACTN|nr:SDR family NAD(P)-dependent oxidoreductase [Thermomonospora umbrina]REF01171.1 short-subunit dehydrogenase [Thermomonospora umbrina]